MTGDSSDPAVFARRLLSQPSQPEPTGGSEKGARSGPATPAYDAESCGDFDIRIARDGTWFYHGTPITRKPLVKLFASVLRRDEQGEYWLQTPVEKGRIRVEDAPFVAVELTVTGEGPSQILTFRTNLDDSVIAGPQHPIRVAPEAGAGGPRPYVQVRAGLEALIARPVFYQLVELGESMAENPPAYGVWSGGVFFPLGRIE
jgi:uncharacterized protein